MTTIVGIIGSLRAASVNRIAFLSAQSVMPTGAKLIEVPVADVPLFDGDIEDSGDLPSVAAFKQAVSDADGLVVFTPEYNVGVPAVTKNAIDWLSRPHGAAPISTKPVGVVAVSPGGRGGVGVRAHLTDTLSVLTPHLFQPMLGIGRVFDHLVEGEVVGEALDELAGWLAGFVTHVTATDAAAETAADH